MLTCGIFPAVQARRFDPLRDLAGLKLWHDYSRIEGVNLEDAAGVTKITRAWDLSGNGNYGWIEDFEPWEPVWSIDSTFGFRYMNGVGIDGDWRAPNWNASGFTEGTGIAVLKKTADPSAAGGVWWTLANHGAFNHFPYTDGNIYDGFASTTRRSWNPTPPLTSWHIYSARSRAGLWKANLDGVEQISDTSNAVDFGASTSILQEKNELHLAAMLVFAKYLDAGELNALGRYLGERFRIPWIDAST